MGCTGALGNIILLEECYLFCLLQEDVEEKVSVLVLVSLTPLELLGLLVPQMKSVGLRL